MTDNKKPECMIYKELSFKIKEENRAVFLTLGGLLTFDKDSAKWLHKALQAFLDYKEPSWIPEPGERYRYDKDGDIWLRCRRDAKQFVNREGYNFTTVCLCDGDLSWDSKENQDRYIKVEEEDSD